MKKSLLLIPAILGLALLAGCSSNKKKEKAQAELLERCEFTPGVIAPEWYCNPEVPNGIAALGEAKPNVAGDNNMQRNMALSNGRDELARQLQVTVQNMLTNWSRATGIDVDQTYEANFENVSRQVTEQTLSGSRQVNRWVAPDGTLVLLVGLTESAELKQAIKTSLNNQQALHQQLQSKKALEELDKQLERTFR